MNNLIVKILDHMETNMRNNIVQYELQCENPNSTSFCEKPFNFLNFLEELADQLNEKVGMQNTFVCQKMSPIFIEFLVSFLEVYESEVFREFFLEIESNQRLQNHISMV